MFTAPYQQKEADMYNKVLESGFHFPEKLEDWISPHWENFDLGKIRSRHGLPQK